MHVTEDFLPDMHAIERLVLEYAQIDPTIGGVDILAVYDRFRSEADRRRRKVPLLPLMITPLQRKLYDFIMQGIASLEEASGNSPFNLEERELIALFDRLIKSVRLWTKENGRKGYVNYISKFII